MATWPCRFPPRARRRPLERAAVPVRENSPCAKKLGKGGEDVNDDTFKTFHWSLVGKQTYPVELGQQPEASLAWGFVRIPAKRRQPVLKPCY
jgi:hypothetical protein